MKDDSKSVTLVIIIIFILAIATYSYVYQNNVCVGEIGQDIDENGNLETPVCNYSEDFSTLDLIIGIVIVNLIVCVVLLSNYMVNKNE